MAYGRIQHMPCCQKSKDFVPDSVLVQNIYKLLLHLPHRVKKLTYFMRHHQATLVSLTCLFRDSTSHQTNGGRSVYHAYGYLGCANGDGLHTIVIHERPCGELHMVKREEGMEKWQPT